MQFLFISICCITPIFLSFFKQWWQWFVYDMKIVWWAVKSLMYCVFGQPMTRCVYKKTKDKTFILSTKINNTYVTSTHDRYIITTVRKHSKEKHTHSRNPWASVWNFYVDPLVRIASLLNQLTSATQSSLQPVYESVIMLWMRVRGPHIQLCMRP